MKQAETYEEIKPLIELCKAGKLFDVQAWISKGKPINPPVPETGRARKRSPLEISIELGFHSLVQVLLQAGTLVDDLRYCPLRHALWKRRLDIIELLVSYGADIHWVTMGEVFDTWNNDIVKYFIQQGADLETGQPLASALCSRIRPALGIYKQYENQFPSFKEQINVALRYHCKEGNLKWVSLMLWAEADPYSKGPCDPGYDPDPDEEISALEYAALYGHLDIFKLKSIKLDNKSPIFHELLRNSCYNDNSQILDLLLEKGFNPQDMEDKGSSLIQSLLSSMSWYFDPYSFSRHDHDIDSSKSREKIKMIHMLVRKGARWEPRDRYDINSARRSLLKMRSDYTMEFVWIMTEYNACSSDAIENLMKTPSMRLHISERYNRYCEIKSSMCS